MKKCNAFCYFQEESKCTIPCLVEIDEKGKCECFTPEEKENRDLKGVILTLSKINKGYFGEEK